MKARGNFSKAMEELMNGKFGDSPENTAAMGQSPSAIAAAGIEGTTDGNRFDGDVGERVASDYAGGVHETHAVPRASGETGRITQDMVISGAVTAVSDLRISGKSVGDVKTDGILMVDGRIEGKVNAGTVTLEGAAIVGDIVSAAGVTIGPGSSVEGDVHGNRVEVDAAITGNIHCSGTVVLHENAAVQGSIEAVSLSMAEGAEWKGDVEITKSKCQGA